MPRTARPNQGTSTWPAEQWRLGGGTVWGWLSYDPELDLIYYGTGNPGVWNPDLRPGDNKWSCSIIARRPDDGHVVWAYQLVPHDHHDYDEIMENVLVDMDWKGQPKRKLLLHPGRTGFMYVLDRGDRRAAVGGEVRRVHQLGHRLRPQDRAAARGSRASTPTSAGSSRTSARRRPAARSSSPRRSRR